MVCGSVNTVSVLSSVALPATADAPAAARATIPGCSRPVRLLPQILDPEDGFTIVAQEGKRIRVQVKDNCDNPMTAGAVRLSITGDSFLLVHEGQGIWASTLTPPSAADSVRMVAEAFQSVGGGRQIDGRSPIFNGRIVNPSSATARAFAGQVRNNATNQPAAQVALGSWVSIHGDRLADAVKIADTVPYPFALLGTEVRLGNLKLPLYYVSANQVNALIPAGLIPNAQHQLLVRRGDTESVPMPITVAEIQPGIYSMNSQGFGQGAVLIANTSILAAPPDSVRGWVSRPAKRGEPIQIYAAGLGPVRNPPPDGAPGAGEIVLDPPEVLIGEQAARVDFAGLAPGLIGLYQVNAVIPTGVTPGAAVPIQFRQRDVLSNIVTIAVD